VTPEPLRFVLASSSPARLQTLRRAGVDPVVHVPGVDEAAVSAASTGALVAALARLKGEAVLADLGTRRDTVIVACDSLLDVDGVAHGKPADTAEARARWWALRGRSAVLLTGHHLQVVREGVVRADTRVAATTVHFAELTDAEVDAYVASGEPLAVAGAFTLDGLGAAFVTGVEGDPHNVVGISVPLLRVMLAEAGIAWPGLWRTVQ
jgi:septum formation protein